MTAREGLQVFTLFGVLFLTSLDHQLLIPILPLLEEETGASLQALGLVFSAYSLAAATAALSLGPLTDRCGRLPFLKAGLLAFALLAAATSAAPGYEGLVVLRGATGLAGGLLSLCVVGLVGDLFAYERRGKIMGIVLSAYFAALIAGVPLSAWLAERWGWRTVFLAASALAFLLLIPALGTFARARVEAGPAAGRSFARGYRALLGRRYLRAALGVSFGVSGGTLAFLTYIPGYLNQTFGLSPVEISSLFVVAGVAALLGSPLAGWLSDRWTKRGVFLTSNSLLVVPLLTLSRLSWGFPLMGAFFILSLGVAFRQSALQTLQTELVGTRERGSFLALRNASSQLGISVCVGLAGVLYSSLGYGAVTLFAALLTLASSGVVFSRVPEPVDPEESV